MSNNKSKLRTDFICIATSGRTVDGREITAQELHEMADNYDPTYYTANLWFEHRRWANFGQVLELKAEDQENGETKLYAVIAPSLSLIEINKQGAGLFTSVEIMPNFRNSGKNYLWGLGVTDVPASVGTTQLNFSQQPKNTLNTATIPFDFSLKDDEKPEIDKLDRSFMSMLKAFFTFHHDLEAIPNNKNNKEDEPMNTEQFNALIAAVNGLGEKIDSRFTAEAQPEANTTQEEPAQVTAPAETVGAEQFNQLLAKVDALTDKFNALSQEQTAVPHGVPADTEQKFNLAI